MGELRMRRTFSAMGIRIAWKSPVIWETDRPERLTTDAELFLGKGIRIA
jgi:hypothetical protein